MTELTKKEFDSFDWEDDECSKSLYDDETIEDFISPEFFEYYWNDIDAEPYQEISNIKSPALSKKSKR